jgi:hypothetical protein
MKKEKKYQQDPYRMRPIQMAVWSGRAISIAVNVIVLMQITFYCTNILAMSPVLVGTLLMASKIFDGVTDIFAGVLIDKTKTRCCPSGFYREHLYERKKNLHVSMLSVII